MSTWHDWLRAVGDVALVVYMLATTATVFYLGHRARRVGTLEERVAELSQLHRTLADAYRLDRSPSGFYTKEWVAMTDAVLGSTRNEEGRRLTMAIVGPDGRAVSSVRAEAPEGGPRCLLCAVREAMPPILERTVEAEERARGLAEGLYAGLKVLSEVLQGSGLDPDRAVAVVGAAASPCETCTAAMAVVETSGRARAAVEVAVGNVRAASVFVVGRGPGGTRAL